MAYFDVLMQMIPEMVKSYLFGKSYIPRERFLLQGVFGGHAKKMS